MYYNRFTGRSIDLIQHLQDNTVIVQDAQSGVYYRESINTITAHKGACAKKADGPSLQDHSKVLCESCGRLYSRHQTISIDDEDGDLIICHVCADKVLQVSGLGINPFMD